jgi:hypothetical protein
MVKTRITNCRFKKIYQPIHTGKSKRKQKRFLVGFFLEKLKKLKCKALSILET